MTKIDNDGMLFAEIKFIDGDMMVRFLSREKHTENELCSHVLFKIWAMLSSEILENGNLEEWQEKILKNAEKKSKEKFRIEKRNEENVIH
jgi:hypothetical protein